MTPCSYLYVPADADPRLQLAGKRGADALIIDLEDGVAYPAKAGARAAAAQYCRQSRAPGPELWVRVNSGDLGEADIAAVICPAVRGVCVPKVAAHADLAAVDALLSRAERVAGLADRSVAVCPLIESAAGLTELAGITRAPRVCVLQIGEADLVADLGAERTPGGQELLLARSMVVAASRAAGLAAPVGAVSASFGDLEAFAAETLALRRLGFRGRACIHPAQIPVVHEVFTPSPAEVREAQAVVQAHEQAQQRGEGVTLDAGGRMLDEAVVRSARNMLAMRR